MIVHKSYRHLFIIQLYVGKYFQSNEHFCQNAHNPYEHLKIIRHQPIFVLVINTSIYGIDGIKMEGGVTLADLTVTFLP